MKIIRILLFFVVISCQTSHQEDKHIFSKAKFLDEKGEKVNISLIVERLNEQKGADKVVIFGKNMLSVRNWVDKDGNFVKQYSFLRKKTKFYEFLPILSYFLPKNYENYEIMINYGKNNELLGTELFHGRISLKGRVFCSDGKGGCVSNYY